MDGRDDSPGEQGLRPAVPPHDGPLSGSGAAPQPTDPHPADPRPADPEPADPQPTPPGPTTAAETDRPGPDGTRVDGTQVDDTQVDDTQVDDTQVDGTRVDDTQVDDTQVEAGGAVVGVAPVAVPVGAAGRGRRVRPVAAVRAVGRAGAAWARRPSGRVIVPSVLAALLIGGAGAAGAYLVPQAIDARPVAGASPSLVPGEAVPSGAPVVPGGPYGSAPVLGYPATPPGATAPTAPVTGPAVGFGTPRPRPADALTGWAQQVGAKVGIPLVAAQAYAYTELVLSRTAPACRLSWTTVAALAKVESDHGSVNGAVLGPDGRSQPPIVGLPLDGKGGRQLIKDTDRGALDGDAVFDRAMGPLQFIPATWRENAMDADNDGVADPNDIDDAALTTGMYLCRDGHDMSKADDWWNAILSYNNVQPYAQQVFTEANGYGQRSRT